MYTEIRNKFLSKQEDLFTKLGLQQGFGQFTMELKRITQPRNIEENQQTAQSNVMRFLKSIHHHFSVCTIHTTVEMIKVSTTRESR